MFRSLRKGQSLVARGLSPVFKICHSPMSSPNTRKPQCLKTQAVDHLKCAGRQEWLEQAHDAISDRYFETSMWSCSFVYGTHICGIYSNVPGILELQALDAMHLGPNTSTNFTWSRTLVTEIHALDIDRTFQAQLSAALSPQKCSSTAHISSTPSLYFPTKSGGG